MARKMARKAKKSVLKGLSPKYKILWAKEYLMPGLKKINPTREFSDKKFIQFFDLAQDNKYEEITKITMKNKIKEAFKDIKAGEPVRYWNIRIMQDSHGDHTIMIPDKLLERIIELWEKRKKTLF